ncbi:hypothetical protein EYF80_007786 [Liparis tanakae]|uniref:Uncharacterized protein n=1 Tax=Liparis tanakae TaxID=230148 RepID=A0A4Z2IWH5_9TELE|nr:hypothetical protein EYF80_007786 [Liparis tanakae]
MYTVYMKGLCSAYLWPQVQNQMFHHLPKRVLYLVQMLRRMGLPLMYFTSISASSGVPSWTKACRDQDTRLDHQQRTHQTCPSQDTVSRGHVPHRTPSVEDMSLTGHRQWRLTWSVRNRCFSTVPKRSAMVSSSILRSSSRGRLEKNTTWLP